MSDKTRLSFIHIGKCGGSTIRRYLYSLDNVEVSHIYHIQSLPLYENLNNDKKFLISIRNPVDRLISAFYWRKYLVYKTKRRKNQFDGEYSFFNEYKTMNQVIDTDISILDKIYVHHIHENINWYLKNFVQKANKDNIFGIICQHRLRKDLEEVFSTRIAENEIKKLKLLDSSKIKKEPLTENQRTILKQYLHKDYECIEKLNGIKPIHPKSLQILLK